MAMTNNNRKSARPGQDPADSHPSRLVGDIDSRIDAQELVDLELFDDPEVDWAEGLEFSIRGRGTPDPRSLLPRKKRREFLPDPSLSVGIDWTPQVGKTCGFSQSKFSPFRRQVCDELSLSPHVEEPLVVLPEKDGKQKKASLVDRPDLYQMSRVNPSPILGILQQCPQEQAQEDHLAVQRKTCIYYSNNTKSSTSTSALTLAQKLHPSYTNFSLVPTTATQCDMEPFLLRKCATATNRNDASKPRGKRGPGLKSQFPSKLHEVLSDPSFSDVIAWMPHGRSWHIPNSSAFMERVGKTRFSQTKWASFRRQACLWGFQRKMKGSDSGSYYHELFLRGMPHLVQFMEKPLALSPDAKQKVYSGRYDDEPDFCKISMVYPLPSLGTTSSTCMAQLPQEQAREDHHKIQKGMAGARINHESSDQKVQTPNKALGLAVPDYNSSNEQVRGERKRTRSSHHNTQRKHQHVQPSAQPPSTHMHTGQKAVGGVKRILLSSDGDSKVMSKLMCLVRAQIEVFAATKQDAEERSRKTPAIGRVGIRCIHCAYLPLGECAKGAVSYPSSIRLMHQAVRNWQRYHFSACREIPNDVREEYERLKGAKEFSTKESQQHWIDCCVDMGMADTVPAGNGIFFHSAASGEASDAVFSGASGKVESDMNNSSYEPNIVDIDHFMTTEDETTKMCTVDDDLISILEEADKLFESDSTVLEGCLDERNDDLPFLVEKADKKTDTDGGTIQEEACIDLFEPTPINGSEIVKHNNARSTNAKESNGVSDCSLTSSFDLGDLYSFLDNTDLFDQEN